MDVSLTAVRRVAIDAQGFAARGRRGTTAEVESTIRRLSCVQLDSISTVDRSHRIALGARIGAYPRDAVSQLLRAGAADRVLGPRGMPPARRGLAALPCRHGERRASLVRRGRPHAPASPRARARRDPLARAARLAPLRGRRPPGRDVGLEAGEADARAPLEPRRARRGGPPGLPAALRRPGARPSAGCPRRADPGGARPAAHARAARRRRRGAR